MWVRISRERRTMREKSQAGALPPWRGSDAYPVLFPADIVRFYATLWADASTDSLSPRATKRRFDGQDSEEEDRTESQRRLHEAHDAKRSTRRGDRRQD